MDKRFPDTRLLKIGKITKVLNDLRMTLNTIKSFLYTQSTYPEAQIVVPFSLRPAALEIQDG